LVFYEPLSVDETYRVAFTISASGPAEQDRCSKWQQTFITYIIPVA
jgi:hypothetical protein